ncbi:MAG: hypothetical protein QGH45_05600 [Myxococcota bacterium]|nr:hypothetical protein [Myxococcota bacterium]
MTTRSWARWLSWGIVVPLLSLASLSCVEIKIVGASVVNGPVAGGGLTVRLDVAIAIEQQEQAEGEEAMDLPAEQTNQACYLAAVVPDGIGVTGGRIVGEEAMVGADGARAMGLSPQIAQVYAREFPLPAGQHWVALHAMLDRVDTTRDHQLALEMDMTGVPTGTSDLLVALGYLDDIASEPDPARPTQLQLVVGADKALVRVVPDEVPVAKEAA